MARTEIPIELQPEIKIQEEIKTATGGLGFFHKEVIVPIPLSGRYPSVFPDEAELPKGVRFARSVKVAENAGGNVLMRDIDGRAIYMGHSHDADAFKKRDGMPYKWTHIRVKLFGVTIGYL